MGVSPHPYLAHWGLAEPPFLVDPDLRFAYERDDHREGLARILGWTTVLLMAVSAIAYLLLTYG